MNHNLSHNLFVYSSLRRGFQHEAFQYLAKYYTFVGEAKIKGKLFDKNGIPVAKETTENSFIQGELYTINKEAELNWAIEQLDDYEGLHVESNETPLYKRITTPVYLKDKVTVAWVYLYNGDVNNYPTINYEDVLQYLQEKNKS
jgi:gamma-glutamylcyclotransferase (GGCT)/AIG2-like uncharacterized protein YtfP